LAGGSTAQLVPLLLLLLLLGANACCGNFIFLRVS
jgi:hypothetical protein